MAVDPAYGNSSGYFRDPTNGEDLTVDTPRTIQCELRDGKFIWPQVTASDGSKLLKIVYRCFTDEEKELYKQYRGRSSSSEPKAKVEKCIVNDEPDEDTSYDIGYDEYSAVSADTAKIIATCDQCLGCSQIAGLTYALLSRKDSNKVYHIPRAAISDKDFTRLCQGVN